MNENRIIDNILSDAKRQAEEILQQAVRQNDQQNLSLDRELTVYRAETDRLAQSAAEDRRERLLAATRMQNSQLMLATKGQVLDELFGKVKDRIEKLPDNEYLELIKSLLQKTVQTGQEQVIIGKQETRITADFISRVSAESPWQTKGQLQLSQTREDIGGGFILVSGKVRINASTDVIVAQLRDKLEMEFAVQLFQ